VLPQLEERLSGEQRVGAGLVHLSHSRHLELICDLNTPTATKN
jgi:hypothetical protein